MLLRRRPPQIDTRPIHPAQGFEHLGGEAIAVLKWLKDNQVEFVLVGPVAEAMRGGTASSGPVAIVPAPDRRNHERLSRALDAAHARPRPEGGARDSREAVAAKAMAEQSGAGERWVSGPGSIFWTSKEGRVELRATRSCSTNRLAWSRRPAWSWMSRRPKTSSTTPTFAGPGPRQSCASRAARPKHPPQSRPELQQVFGAPQAGRRLGAR